MGAGGSPVTVKVVFRRRTVDGSVRQGVTFNTSSAGAAHAGRTLQPCERARGGCECGVLLSPVPWEAASVVSDSSTYTCGPQLIAKHGGSECC